VLHPAAPAVPPPKRPDQRSAKPLLLVLLVCLAPVVLAFLAYYLPATGLRPDSANNYGTLIQPQRPVPDAPNLGLITLDGEPFDLRSLAGKWVLLAKTLKRARRPDPTIRKMERASPVFCENTVTIFPPGSCCVVTCLSKK